MTNLRCRCHDLNNFLHHSPTAGSFDLPSCHGNGRYHASSCHGHCNWRAGTLNHEHRVWWRHSSHSCRRNFLFYWKLETSETNIKSLYWVYNNPGIFLYLKIEMCAITAYYAWWYPIPDFPFYMALTKWGFVNFSVFANQPWHIMQHPKHLRFSILVTCLTRRHLVLTRYQLGSWWGCG